VAAREERIREIARGLIEHNRAKGEFDFVMELAAWLPLVVIGDMLGIERDHYPKLLEWSDTLLRGTIPKRVFDDLVGKGLVKTGSVPGLRWFPHETVFMPRALPVLNRHINWRIDRLEL